MHLALKCSGRHCLNLRQIDSQIALHKHLPTVGGHEQLSVDDWALPFDPSQFQLRRLLSSPRTSFEISARAFDAHRRHKLCTSWLSPSFIPPFLGGRISVWITCVCEHLAF